MNIEQRLLTALVDFGFLWVIFTYGLDGVDNAIFLLTNFGIFPWLILGAVVFLVIWGSDYRMDVLLFFAGYGLGYWGEWWGTTRGVWTYWNGATPPVYLPPLWGIGLLTVFHLGSSIISRFKGQQPRWALWLTWACLTCVPVLAFTLSWQRLITVDWRGRLDIHFIAGLAVSILLILYRFDLRKTVVLYLCGTFLGGTYEYLGTSWGEWRYITGEVPPLWIAPLWGYAAVAMVQLASIVRSVITQLFQMGKWVKSGA